MGYLRKATDLLTHYNEAVEIEEQGQGQEKLQSIYNKVISIVE